MIPLGLLAGSIAFLLFGYLELEFNVDSNWFTTICKSLFYAVAYAKVCLMVAPSVNKSLINVIIIVPLILGSINILIGIFLYNNYESVLSTLFALSAIVFFTKSEQSKLEDLGLIK
tara:strand:- start:2999 stop:3346 length:348 start_codon:yes stop_codon:yes gene_type:complete